MPSSYGYAALAAAILGILMTILLALRGMRRRERAAVQAQDLADGNKVVADANRAAADAALRDLGPTPGIRVQPRDKPTGEL